MNLTCSGGSLPKRGCLFFKVVGKTNVTERKNAKCLVIREVCLLYECIYAAKFNCTVPGTLHEYSAECPLPEIIFHPSSSKPPIPPGPVTTNSSGIEIISNNFGTHLTVGSLLLYILVGAGGGVCTIILSLCLFCVCIFCRRKQMKGTVTIYQLVIMFCFDCWVIYFSVSHHKHGNGKKNVDS